MRNLLLLASLLAAVSCRAEEPDDFPVSFSASADIESAYICCGYVWDTRPYSAQDAGMEVDLGAFGSIAASVWSYSPMSSSGHSDAISHTAA